MSKHIKIPNPTFDSDFFEKLNNEMPISLEFINDLVDRVHEKYNVISKVEVALIIRETLSIVREQLILGKTLDFNNFIRLFKFSYYYSYKNNKNYPHLETSVSLPRAKIIKE